MLLAGFGFCFFLTAFGFHKYYVGYTELAFKPDDQRLEISVRLFSDDVETALERNGHGQVVLAENDTLDGALRDYFVKNFRLMANSRPLELNYLGKQVEFESTWFYLSVEEVKRLKRLSLTNELLMDVYPEQTHLVRFSTGGKEESALLKEAATTHEFSLK